MNIISSSYGNDSIALIQWSLESGLPDIIVVYCDTGWAALGWNDRVSVCEDYCHKQGLKTIRLESIGMKRLVQIKKGWPGNGLQFCTSHLKGLPFLEWVETFDKEKLAKVLIGKRRAESKNRRDTQQFIVRSEYHGERWVWHPLYLHSDKERDELVKRSGIELLPHRSLECNPCVNANRGDFLRLKTEEIEKVNAIEVEIAKPMFRPKRYGVLGIYGVLAWAKFGPKRVEEDMLEDEGCGAPFGCGL